MFWKTLKNDFNKSMLIESITKDKVTLHFYKDEHKRSRSTDMSYFIKDSSTVLILISEAYFLNIIKDHEGIDLVFEHINKKMSKKTKINVVLFYLTIGLITLLNPIIGVSNWFNQIQPHILTIAMNTLLSLHIVGVVIVVYSRIKYPLRQIPILEDTFLYDKGSKEFKVDRWKELNDKHHAIEDKKSFYLDHTRITIVLSVLVLIIMICMFKVVPARIMDNGLDIYDYARLTDYAGTPLNTEINLSFVGFVESELEPWVNEGLGSNDYPSTPTYQLQNGVYTPLYEDENLVLIRRTGGDHEIWNYTTRIKVTEFTSSTMYGTINNYQTNNNNHYVSFRNGTTIFKVTDGEVKTLLKYPSATTELIGFKSVYNHLLIQLYNKDDNEYIIKDYNLTNNLTEDIYTAKELIETHEVNGSYYLEKPIRNGYELLRYNHGELERIEDFYGTHIVSDNQYIVFNDTLSSAKVFDAYNNKMHYGIYTQSKDLGEVEGRFVVRYNKVHFSFDNNGVHQVEKLNTTTLQYYTRPNNVGIGVIVLVAEFGLLSCMYLSSVDSYILNRQLKGDREHEKTSGTL